MVPEPSISLLVTGPKLWRGIGTGRVAMMVSVAMCTHNGGRFLSEQLSAIVSQTYPPDEVVVCDDVSTDSTVPTLEQFRSSAPFPVRVFANERRLGYVKNFEQVMKRCAGDIIVTCDQDDSWLPNRLASVARAFRDGDVGLVVCDAQIVDEDLMSLGTTLWHRTGFWKLAEDWRDDRDEQVRRFLKANPVYGATMALRRSVVDSGTPIPECWPHDNWLSLIAAATSRVVLINTPLVLYRQHEGQQAPFRVTANTVRTLPTFEWCKVVAEEYEMLLQRLNAIPWSDPRARDLVEAKQRHLLRRASLHGRSVPVRLALGLGEMANGGYQRYSNGWRSLARDVVNPQ